MSAPLTPPAPIGDPFAQPLRGASFGQAIQRFFQKYGTFAGRASRSEYWYSILGFIIGYVVLAVLAQMSNLFAVLALLFVLAIIVPSWAVGARRLHDIGKSGWWQLITFIPLVGGIILIVWFATAPKPEGDRYNG